jgi:hypothetical protein
VLSVLGTVAAQVGATLSADKTQSFRPGRPQPTHRYTTAM